MKILLTGASGFLGQQVIKDFTGVDFVTLATKNADINVDLSTTVPAVPVVDLVIHAAGKAHTVPSTIQDANNFYNINVGGLHNLLIGLEKASALPHSLVYISSVAVYGVDNGTLIDENAPLLATEPYGASKIEAERLVQHWCTQNNVICTILRLPLIVGPNPPGNLKAMINGIKKGYYFNIAGGAAKKSMVLAQDVAKIIPVAASIGGIYNLTDGFHPNFGELSNVIAVQLGKTRPLNIPLLIALILAKVGDLIGSKSPINSRKLAKITSDLTFDDTRARHLLAWKPLPVLKGFKIS